MCGSCSIVVCLPVCGSMAVFACLLMPRAGPHALRISVFGSPKGRGGGLSQISFLPSVV